MDIDAVSLATFDIDRNGILQLHSPYADITSMEMMEASEQLPLPSGQAVEIQTTDNVDSVLEFFDKYQSLFEIAPVINRDGEPSNEVSVRLNLSTPEHIKLLGLLVQENVFKSDEANEDRVLVILNSLFGFIPKTKEQLDNVFNEIKSIIDYHNLYFDYISDLKISRIMNNYNMSNMYNIIRDASNLIQAQTPIDSATGPLKRVANKSKEAKELRTRTPGNFVNKCQSIFENQVGKDGIAICAVGLKAFFGLTQYNNYILNYGTAELLNRLLLRSDGSKGYMISGKLYSTLANIRSKDPNTITNADVLEALSLAKNDTDAAVVLSALLSLSTDSQ